MSTVVANAAESPSGPGTVKLPIYLDNHATTPIDPQVLEAMMPYLTGDFGNPASRSHEFGWKAQAAVDTARAQIARLIGASAKEIVFTSGSTESNNLAIKGAAERYREKGKHIITVATEHKSVLDCCKHLEKYGYQITYLPVKPDGLIDLDRLRAAFTSQTILVSLMAANNEIGVLQPLDEIGRLCREHGAFFHCDAAQAVGKVPVDVNRSNIDLLSINGHKMYGPKGIGALYVRENPRVELQAQIDGGGHEHGMRSGTLNVPGIAGLGMACELSRQAMEEEGRRTAALRDRLKYKLFAELDLLQINGSLEHRLPGNLNISFLYTDGEALLTGIKDVAVSSGAACISDKIEPSYVLKALGMSDDAAQCAVRFGIGRFNTEAEIDYVAAKVISVAKSLREFSDKYEEAKLAAASRTA